MSIFHRSAEFIAKHKRHHHLALATLALIIASAGVYTYRHEFAQAATYYFTQTSWAGGLTASTATHASNQSNWTQYTATSSTSVLASASGVSLASTTKSFIDDGSTALPSARYGHTVNVLPDGRVLVVGGRNNAGVVQSTTYLGTVNGNATTWVASTALPAAITSHTTTLLPDGRILVVGGSNQSTTYLGTINGNSITWVVSTAFPTLRDSHTTTLLSDGRILVTGGYSNFSIQITTYIGTISGNSITWVASTNLPAYRAFHTASSLSDGRILIIGGTDNNNDYNTTYIGTVSGNSIAWVASTGLPANRWMHRASVLSDGRILVTGGTSAGTVYSTSYIGTVSGNSIAWVASTALPVALNSHTESTLSDGRIFVTGGDITNQGSVAQPTTYIGTINGNSITWGGGFTDGNLSSTMVIGTSTAASVGINLGFSATGGTVTTSGSYTIHTFTAIGTSTFQVTQGNTNVEYFVVAGGGSGGKGNGAGGGGGGGGLLTSTGYSVTTGSYTVVVGGGGATSTGSAGGNNGGNSTFGTIVATGGGGGGVYTAIAGKNGGSGGGGGASNGVGVAGGVATVSPVQGNNGGTGGATLYVAGGGGGAGAVGGNSTATKSGDGGVGVTSNFSGASIVYAAGGGGGTENKIAGTGGSGIGGGGSTTTVAGGPGAPNTGSGGGGGGAVGGSGGPGGSGIIMVRYLTTATTPVYSGTFTSAVIDTGAYSNFTTLGWTETLNGQTITMKARSSNSPTMVGATAFASCGTIAKNAAFSTQSPSCVTNGHRYIQYEATLNTSDPAVTPTLNDVTINYTQYALAGNLTSSKYDTGVTTNTFSKVSWVALDNNGNALDNADEKVRFQVRTASTSADLDNAAWCGPTDCSGSYFTFAENGQAITGNSALTDHINDQWLQYKVFLTSGGDLTPVLSSVSLQYVQNGAPVVPSVTAAQVTTPTDPNYGKVVINFDASDGDTASGTIPYIVTPTLYRYYNGTSWTNISPSEITRADGQSAYSTISIPSNTSTTNTSVVWTPMAGIAYTNGAKIEVTVDDGEGANRFGVGTSGTFPLDSTPPSVTVASFDSTQDVVNITETDATSTEFRLCNDVTFSACLNWTTIATHGVQPATSWTPASTAPGAEIVYLQVRDAYGNMTPLTLTAPPTPDSFKVADVSNPGASTFGETLSWISYPGATYNVYYATTSDPAVAPVSYAPLSGAMGISSNVFPHVISPAASSSAYWYKVSTVGTSGVSNFAVTAKGDVPDSFGTAVSDTTKPNVTSVATSSVLSTSAVVTVTTDELSSIQIFYSSAGAVADCSYSQRTPPSAVYSTSTVVTLTGLTASTTYNFCVKATDIAKNTSLGISGTENSFFTTVSGPGMVGASTFTVTSNTATINWTTSTTSDSYVTYGTPVFGTNNKRIGVSTYTTTTDGSGNYVHAITLTGLTAGTDYYYQVESSNALGTTIDTNTGAYYHFQTTIDTTPPVITGTSTPVLAPNAAVIVWQTDEPATSKIDYGLTTAYGKGVAEDTALTIWHVMTLSSSSANAYGAVGDTNALTKETAYSYRITSKDAANNPATADGTFTTPADGNVTVVVVSVRAGDTKDTTPPSISNVIVSDITPFGATVKFGTGEDAVSFVSYGKDTSYGAKEGDDEWTSTKTIKLHGLTLGTDYHIKVSAIDKSGNTGTSADQTFKTTFLSENLKDMANVENIEQFQKEIESAIESILPSLVPPFVTKPIISDITESGATVSFKTNIKAFPVVVYAEDGAYDETKDNPYTGEVSDTVTKDTAHTLALTGLKGNTKYHVQARAFSLPKVIGKSADVTFITKASKIAGSIVERKKDSFTVVWTTDEPTTSIVEFKDLKRGITERKVDEAKKTSHSMKVENLPSGTAYEVNLSGLTEQGNIAEAGSPLSVTTSTDTTPPTISGFKVDNALVPGRTDRIQTIVSWMTDEPANSTVYFEEGAGTAGNTAELANKNEVLDSFVTSHSIILPSLKPGTIYRLKVTSSDDSGNLGSFGPRTVITPQQTASITDIIFKNFEDSFKFLRKI